MAETKKFAKSERAKKAKMRKKAKKRKKRKVDSLRFAFASLSLKKFPCRFASLSLKKFSKFSLSLRIRFGFLEVFRFRIRLSRKIYIPAQSLILTLILKSDKTPTENRKLEKSDSCRYFLACRCPPIYRLGVA
jgi:hypothetical protein